MSRCLRLPALLALALSLSVSLCPPLARPAFADAKVTEVERPASGEDETLYNCKQGKAPVTITLKPESEVKDLLTWVMSFTCKAFVLDPRVVLTGRKVTVVAPKAMTPAEAYRVFLVAMATVNLTIVLKGEIYRVVDANQVKKETVPLLRQGVTGSSEEVARYVYRPSYAQAETIKQAFGALKSDAGDIQTIGSVLLLTDYQSNLRDMMSLAKQIDVPGGTEGVYTIPVKYADAAKLSQKLGEFLGVSSAAAAMRPRPEAGAAGAATPAPEVSAIPSKIMVDDRTNTLVLASSEAGYLRVKTLVERLDIPLEVEGGAAFHVYRLTNALADELSQTLNQAIGASPPPQTATAPRGDVVKPLPGAPTPAPAPASVPGQLGKLEGPVRVIGDKPSNSLIVMSSGRDFLALRNMIRELDLPRRQVFIEVMILDVAVGDGLQLGASWHGGKSMSDGSVALGSMQSGSINTLDPKSIGLSSGPLFGLIGKSVQLFGQTIPSYGVLLQAVATTSNLNIKSEPSIIALDNESTMYKVGLNIPVKEASFTGIGGGSVPSGAQQTTFTRRPLLLQFELKPHISTDENLLLEVKHEAEELQGQSEDGGGPIWSTRSIDTRVVVRDQQTVVIGGMLQERETTDTRKVPLLGDIPLLGHLFKHTEKSMRKTNLLIMLTPYIVKDQIELQAIQERKQREHAEFVRAFHGLSEMHYAPEMDYARKRGLLEEINRTVLDVEADTAARASLHPLPTVLPGVVETPAQNP